MWTALFGTLYVWVLCESCGRRGLVKHLCDGKRVGKVPETRMVLETRKGYQTRARNGTSQCVYGTCATCVYVCLTCVVVL